MVDAEISALLGSMGAIVLEGPKSCGKTVTGRRWAESEVLLDVDRNARRAVALDPDLVLDGATPRLIDEWQIEPDIWNHIRRAVDRRAGTGQFILTGSALPPDDVTRHTGAGRLARVRMRPMSLYEAGRSAGSVSLTALLDGDAPEARKIDWELKDLVEVISVGGWPGHLGRSVSEAARANRSYLDEIRRVDVGRVGEKERDPARLGRFLHSLARNVATCASISTLAADVSGAEGLHRHTASDYLAALERLMIVEDQPAWSTHLRSRSTLRQAPKRHFVDPSLAVAALRAGPERLLSDLEYLGFLLESLVVRDLRIHARAADAEVFHYRDNTGLEVDAVVETAAGRWAAFEVKLGGEDLFEEGARNLRRLRERVDTSRRGEPTALGVIEGAGTYVMREEGGIWRIPIAALGP